MNKRYITKFYRIKEVYNFENDAQTIRHILRNYKDIRLSDEENDLTKPLKIEETKE